MVIGVCLKYVTNLVVILVEAVKQDAATEQPGDGNFRKRLSGHGSVHIKTRPPCRTDRMQRGCIVLHRLRL